MKAEDKIRERYGTDPGFKVPEGYFDNIYAKIATELPAKDPVVQKPLTMWQRVRPYVYLAAMFAGIWCMVKMVDLMGSNTIGTPSQAAQSEQILAQAIEDEMFIEDYCYEDVDEYSLLESMYEDGYEIDNIAFESSK